MGLGRSGMLGGFERLLGPLEEYDRRYRGDLVKTLGVFFRSNANASEAAERLYLHRNSLNYRLERIQQVTGLDLRNPDARLALQLGLLASESRESGEKEKR